MEFSTMVGVSAARSFRNFCRVSRTTFSMVGSEALTIGVTIASAMNTDSIAIGLEDVLGNLSQNSVLLHGGVILDNTLACGGADNPAEGVFVTQYGEALHHFGV